MFLLLVSSSYEVIERMKNKCTKNRPVRKKHFISESLGNCSLSIFRPLQLVLVCQQIIRIEV